MSPYASPRTPSPGWDVLLQPTSPFRAHAHLSVHNPFKPTRVPHVPPNPPAHYDDRPARPACSAFLLLFSLCSAVLSVTTALRSSFTTAPQSTVPLPSAQAPKPHATAGGVWTRDPCAIPYLRPRQAHARVIWGHCGRRRAGGPTLLRV